MDEVGKALGFATRWEFECVYSAMTHRRCRNVQQLTPLSKAEPEELISALRPCWWSGNRKLSIEIPSKKERPSWQVMTEAEEQQLVENRRRREEMTKELRAEAVDFFAMKCTGAELIVPIFEFQKPMEAAA